jgi:hypothetical protein
MPRAPLPFLQLLAFKWAANWASSVEYLGTVGLRLLFLDFSAPVFFGIFRLLQKVHSGAGDCPKDKSWGQLRDRAMTCFSEVLRSMLPSVAELGTGPIAELGTWPLVELGIVVDSQSVSQLSWDYFFLDPGTM